MVTFLYLAITPVSKQEFKTIFLTYYGKFTATDKEVKHRVVFREEWELQGCE